MNFETQRNEFFNCLESGDTDGMRRVVSDIIDTALADAQRNQEASDLLAFWSDDYEQDTLIASVCDDKERLLHEQCQAAKDQTSALEEALPKRQRWIEKLILIVGIQRMQDDPRQQSHGQVEQARLELQRKQEEIGQLEEELSERIADLRNKL